jgi:phage-related minor tail protein
MTIGELVGYVGLDNTEFRQGLDDSESRFERFGDGLQTAAAAAGVAAGAALGAALGESMNIEASTDRVAAQLDLTAEESERVGNAAGTLFANAYGGSIEEVNAALRGVIANTGDLGDISDEELTAMGAKALDLAVILEEDVARVAQIAGQAVREGLAADMTEAFDLIAAASARTMPGLQADVLDAADEYGQFFSQLGFSGEEAFGLLAAASAGGTYEIDKTGDALKEFSLLATDMSESSQDAFETIGLDAHTMANNLLAGGDTAKAAFDEIVKGILAIEDPATRANTAIALFGTPLEDIAVTDIPAFLSGLIDAEAALDSTGGAADRMGATLNDNAAASFTTLGRTIQTDFVEAMEPALPLLQKLAGWLMPLAPYLLPIAAAIAAVTAVQWLWNAAMLANPIGLIIVAIVALIAIIVALVQNWDTIRAVIVIGWELLKTKASEIFSAIGEFFIEWWPWIFAIFTGGLSLVVGWVIDNWDEIKSVTSTVFNAIGNFFVGIWRWFEQQFDIGVRAIAAVLGWFGSLDDKFRSWFGAAKDAAVQRMVALVTWANGLPGQILDALGDLGSYLLDKGEALLNGLWNGMKNVAGSIKDWIWGLLEGIAGDVKDFFGIASPSRLMMGFGENIGAGLALGIRKSIAGVSIASNVLATAALPDIGGTNASAAAAAVQFSEADRELLNRVASSMGRIEVTTHGPTRTEINRVNAMAVA